jgi:DNA-binding HxlR family transcriptional regulator
MPTLFYQASTWKVQPFRYDIHMPRRSYDQYCAVARALDTVGERWSLLIIRELFQGPQRYTDLHADLPGVATDILSSRLKQLESDGLIERRKLERPANTMVYELTARGAALRPVIEALAAWGLEALGEPRPTDAMRQHWFTNRPPVPAVAVPVLIEP